MVCLHDRIRSRCPTRIPLQLRINACTTSQPPKPATATSSPMYLGRSPRPNGSTPSTSTITSGSPHPSMASNAQRPERERDRPTDRSLTERDGERKANAFVIEQSLRAAREATGLLAAGPVDPFHVQEATGSPIGVASTSDSMGATSAAVPSTSTSTTAMMTTALTTASKKPMAFSWGSLSWAPYQKHGLFRYLCLFDL
jgi:hypothetical protein